MREMQAQANLARAQARKATTKPINSLDELYSAVTMAKAVMEKLKPKSLGGGSAGDNNIDAFGQWFDRSLACVALLARYQLPLIRPVDAPTPPPEVKAEERIVFGLRVFEGGKPVHEIEDEDE
jgi:hypothetical protein